VVALPVMGAGTPSTARATADVVTTGQTGKGVPERTPEQLEALAREVSGQLRCPVCQGLSIQDSPADLAVEMKNLVREQLAAGKTPAEIKAFFTTKYGEWVLLEPKAAGFNLTAYLLPIIAVLGGGVVVWRAVRRWTTAPSTPADTGQPPG
jgi:cytochrome c-type biogenesis protein CcmH